MSINDSYRTLGVDQGQTGGLARVRTMRQKLASEYDHVLLLHAGDFLHPSFASKQDNGSSMIQIMNHLDGAFESFDPDMLITFGNHEFDKDQADDGPMLSTLLTNSEFTWLDSNIRWQPNFKVPHNVMPYALKHYGDVTVGVFSYTTDMQKPAYVESFDHFAETAARYVPLLKKQGADVVVALTHQWLKDDRHMMRLPEDIRPDIIFGGHEHYAQIESINNRWIIKADADAASVAVITLNGTTIEPPTIVPMKKEVAPDPDTLQWATRLHTDIQHDFCQDNKLPLDCLDQVVGRTQVMLQAEETHIRRFESNLGNLLADLSLDAFKTCGAQMAVLNSGAIRLNQNIAAGSDITEQYMAEMLPYPSDLRLIEITGQTLHAMLNHSTSNWTASGHWLQVAGVAFIHDSEAESASHIHIQGQSVEVDSQQRYRVVVPNYLITPKYDQDGYLMLNQHMQVNCPATGAEVAELFKTHMSNHPEGISPHTSGRICHVQTQGCHQ